MKLLSAKDHAEWSTSAANWIIMSAKMLHTLSQQQDQPNAAQKIEKMLATHHNAWVI